VAYPLHGLALLYQRQNRYSEALSCYQRALDIREKVFGFHHDLTRTTAKDYASLLHVQKLVTAAYFPETRFSVLNIRSIDPEERETIEEYLFLNEQDLYSLIPPYVVENALYAPQGQVEAGKTWFQRIESQLRKRLCEEWGLCKKLDDPTLTDQIHLVVAIGDAIVGQIEVNPPIPFSPTSVCRIDLSAAATGNAPANQAKVIPATLIAAILVKKGLHMFCHCSQKQGEC
jgi:hypothetical protein